MTLVAMSAEFASWIVLVAALVTTARLVLGPGVADRAVSLDLLSALVAAFAGLRALVTDIDAYLDVAAALALVGFLGTLAFARFVAKRGPRPGEFEERARLRLRRRS